MEVGMLIEHRAYIGDGLRNNAVGDRRFCGIAGADGNVDTRGIYSEIT